MLSLQSAFSITYHSRDWLETFFIFISQTAQETKWNQESIRHSCIRIPTESSRISPSEGVPRGGLEEDSHDNRIETMSEIITSRSRRGFAHSANSEDKRFLSRRDRDLTSFTEYFSNSSKIDPVEPFPSLTPLPLSSISTVPAPSHRQ